MACCSDEWTYERTAKYEKHSASILSMRTINALAFFLDQKLPILKNFRYRDFRGVAELLQFDRQTIEMLAGESCSEPTRTLFDMWAKCDPSRTINILLECLLDLERFDILQDVGVLIDKDIRAHQRRKRTGQVQVPVVSSPTIDIEPSSPRPSHGGRTKGKEIVTVDDTQHYDAFISYTVEDIKFVKKMIDILENKHGCTLMVADRDLLPGTSTHTVTADIIEKRCTRMVIILSRSFLDSSECEFQVKFAHCLSPGSRDKRLIPVLIDESFSRDDVPPVLKHVTMCDYTKKDLQEWFWKRLAQSVKKPQEVSDKPDSDALSMLEYQSQSDKSVHFSSQTPGTSSSDEPYFMSPECSSSSTQHSTPMDTALESSTSLEAVPSSSPMDSSSVPHFVSDSDISDSGSQSNIPETINEAVVEVKPTKKKSVFNVRFFKGKEKKNKKNFEMMDTTL